LDDKKCFVRFVKTCLNRFYLIFKVQFLIFRSGKDPFIKLIHSLSLYLSLSMEKEEQFLHGRNHGEKSWLGWVLNP
jgi:hypothetical protein